jgi:hypothetical protein
MILYRKVLSFIKQFMALHYTATNAPPAEGHTNFAYESVWLIADNIWNYGKLLTLWTA